MELARSYDGAFDENAIVIVDDSHSVGAFGARGRAHAVLAPALEGFSPTPEFPEIAEAQTLLSALTT